MAYDSIPWDGTSPGDAGPYSSADWAEMYRHLIGTGAEDANRGPLRGFLNEFACTANAPVDNSVNVATGVAMVNGRWVISDSAVSVAMGSNVGVHSRIDTIVFEIDYVLQTSQILKVSGTPAASPAPPALTQVDGTTWQIPLFNILVTAGALPTIAQTDIYDVRDWANVPNAIMVEVANTSGAVLEHGDVVIWDGSADSSVTTTTSAGVEVAGVAQGRIAIGGSGRIMVLGITEVNQTGIAITRNNKLIQSGTAGQCTNSGGLSGVFGRALETSASGSVLAFVNCVPESPAEYDTSNAGASYNTTSVAFIQVGAINVSVNARTTDLIVLNAVVSGVFSAADSIEFQWYDNTAAAVVSPENYVASDPGTQIATIYDQYTPPANGSRTFILRYRSVGGAQVNLARPVLNAFVVRGGS